jgi:PAS domain S-box-containing protein
VQKKAMDKKNIRLLYIEDDLVDQMAFKRLIKEHNLPFDLTLAGSIRAGREVFNADVFDIVISDFLLGDGTSFEILPEMIKTGIPVIMITGTGDEDVAVKAIKMGASDYLIKDVDYGHLKMLPLVIESSLNKKHSDDRIKKLSMAVEQSPSMLVITNKEGLIEYINPRVTEITGYTSTDILGTSIFTLHSNHNPAEMVDDIAQTLLSGKKWVGNTYHARKSGELFWESTAISPIYDNEGHLTGYIRVAEDITEKKKTEEAIKKYSEELRESNASKDKMFSIIAHDLRTPFNGLLAFSDILSNDFESLSKDEVQEYIEVIRDLSRNTFNLLEKLLQWSRLQTGRMEFKPSAIDIDNLTKSVANLLSASAKGKNIKLSCSVEEGLQVYGDTNMIHAVIRNLTSNAIKFTPENGSVNITALKLSDIYTEITVSDNGIGMKTDEINKLFRIECQHSTKGTKGETGTGLGLLLCKEFVDLNNGTIRVESEPGAGSRFIITLPLTEN